jgi:hypothetical protein
LWREDLTRTFDALACCGMLDRLTPDHQPGPDKYRLLCATLAALDESPSRWLVAAFGLRLAERIGISLRERAPESAASIWAALHDESMSALVHSPADETAIEAALRRLDVHFAAHAGRRLRVFDFREAWNKTAAEGVPA